MKKDNSMSDDLIVCKAAELSPTQAGSVTH